MPASKKSFDSPDESRQIGNGTVNVVAFDTATAARATMNPGWRWSTDVKPIMGTDSCQLDHLGYALSGRLHVATEDGGETEIAAGDAYVIGPGHDAWVVGDEPFEGLEFQSKTAETYGKL